MAKVQPDATTIAGLQSHAGYWLRFVSNHVSYAFARKLSAFHVTVAEWVLLRQMFDRERMAPSNLAETTGLTRGAVSKLVDRLVDKKLVKREFSHDDRRFQSIALSPSGRRLVPTLAAAADENDEQFFSALHLGEREALLRVLKKLVRVHGLTKIPTE
ncbi:MAG: MarR family transcriptional regulator [Terriglobales bacterium]